ncbi:MAG TPA: sigma 54-interacting transcriptional regulator [Firmicutes bacterium]|nr:sigma 54-interacting transcriptional regulator [Bacillota bacterium]
MINIAKTLCDDIRSYLQDYLEEFRPPVLDEEQTALVVFQEPGFTEITARGIWGRLTPQTRSELVSELRRVYSERLPDMEQVVRLDGLRDELSASAVRLSLESNGTYVMLLVISEGHQLPIYEGLLKVIAHAIHVESILRAQILQNRYIEALAESMSDGFMVLDKRGVVLYVNEVGLSMLGLTKDVVGRNLRDITLFEPEIFEVLRTGKGWTDKEFIVDLVSKKNIHLVKTAIPIFGRSGEVIAVVDTFKEIQTVKKLVNKISGAQAKFAFSDIVYRNQEMGRIVQFAKKIAQGTSPVLIYGESGTGKELFAHAIHRSGPKRDGPFIVVDCSAIPHELAESELFGYVEGAFTGARRGGRPGKFEMANGGTIFLDEIGELPLEIQKKFLRVLETKTITRVGDYVPIPVDVRVIAATNRNLEKEVAEKNFREDLFFRLNVISFTIPPLRERPEDILPIAESFISKFEQSMGKSGIRLSPEAESCLLGYDWPGNVRELRNAIERALNLVEGDVIMPEHLPSRVVSSKVSKTQPASDQATLEAVERRTILSALKTAKGNKKETARLLGISRSTLYDKLRKYGIDYV